MRPRNKVKREVNYIVHNVEKNFNKKKFEGQKKKKK